MNVPKPQTTAQEKFYDAVDDKAMVYVLGFLAGGFGAIMLAEGLNRLSTGVEGDDLFLIVFGVVVLALTGLTGRFILGPRITLTRDRLIVRRFFRTESWHYENIVGLTTHRKKIKPRVFHPDGSSRATGETLWIQVLTLTLTNGDQPEIILPNFVNNPRLLNLLSQRADVEISD